MLILNIFIISCIIFDLFDAKTDEHREVGVAIGKALRKLVEKDFSKIDIFTFSRDSTHFDETIREILKVQHNIYISIRIKKLESFSEFTVDCPLVILFEEAKRLVKFLETLRLHNTQRIANYGAIVYFPLMKDKMFSQVSYSRLSAIRGYIFRKDGDLTLQKRFFKEGYCHARKLTTLNTFSSESMRWRKSRFFRPTKKFYGCPFVYRIEDQYPNEMWTEVINENGHVSYKTGGFNVKIINEIAAALNFTVLYNPSIYATMGSQQMLKNKTEFRSTVAMSGLEFYSQPYMYDFLGYLAPPAQTYTSFEKLFLAFDNKVWILIGVTFAVAFIVIFALRFVPSKLQEIVFGSRIVSPWFNVIGAFFGMGQVTLPRRSFSRFLLMSFILYSLIIRTAYQGKSFEVLQKDVHKKPIRTVEEIGEKDWPVLSHVNLTPMVVPYRFVI